jgi:hypothetical protein
VVILSYKMMVIGGFPINVLQQCARVGVCDCDCGVCKTDTWPYLFLYETGFI